MKKILEGKRVLTRLKLDGKKALMMDEAAEWYGLTMMPGALWSYISVESKEMRGGKFGLYRGNGTEDERALRFKWVTIKLMTCVLRQWS